MENPKPAILLLEKPGYFQTTEGHFYLLSSKENLKVNEEMSDIEFLYSGPTLQNLTVKKTSCDHAGTKLAKFLKLIEDTSEENFYTLLGSIGAIRLIRLSMKREVLYRIGMKFGAVHFVGPLGSGKSTMRQ